MVVPHLNPRAVFSELRRRRLFNTVALYIVGAWVVLQVTELALPALNIPDIAIRYVWIGAFLLFPLVLLFAWRYDVSSGGIRRTAPADAIDADTALQRRDHWVIGFFVSIALAVIIAIGLRISEVEPGLPLAAVENSIAVLPFEACEDRAREQQLAGGLTLEVINRLAERGKLKVIARTSSFALAGIGLSKAEIARPLGVQYLLTGELCRSGNGLTLAAELSDAQGFIVWSDRFSQEVNQWEQVAERLATLVASGVAAELGDVTAASPELPVNAIAYEQFLIGTDHWNRGDRDQARAAFTRALERDPEYAEARAYLVLLDTVGFLSEGRRESIEQARPKSSRRWKRLGASSNWTIAALTTTTWWLD